MITGLPAFAGNDTARRIKPGKLHAEAQRLSA